MMASNCGIKGFVLLVVVAMLVVLTYDLLLFQHPKLKHPKHLPYCKMRHFKRSDTLKYDGTIHVELNATKATSSLPESITQTIKKGGWWHPSDCKAKKEVRGFPSIHVHSSCRQKIQLNNLGPIVIKPVCSAYSYRAHVKTKLSLENNYWGNYGGQ